MTVSFVRQLGAEAGVQLNPLRDGSEIPVQDNYDQIIGIMMRATRGRIDKPFKVHRGTAYKKLGRGEPVRTNALNEAWVHVVEAVNSGAYEVVVQRLVPETAVIKYAVADVPSPGMGGQVTATITTGSVTALSITTPGTGYTTAPNIVISGGGGSGATATCAVTAGAITSVTLTSGGSGYTSAPTVSVVPVAVHAFDWSVSTTLPAGFDIAIKHLDCHNDGVQFELHSDEIKYGGVAQPTKVVTLRVRDKEGFLQNHVSDGVTFFPTEIEICPSDTVWVTFIGGDARYPLIVGYRNPRAGNHADWRRWHHKNIEIIADDELRLVCGVPDGKETSTIIMTPTTIYLDAKAIIRNAPHPRPFLPKIYGWWRELNDSVAEWAGDIFRKQGCTKQCQKGKG